MIEVVCGVIVGADGRILACRRDLRRHLGGKWEFPGGKVDPKESHENALRRELTEELGIEVIVERPLKAVVEWTDGDVSIRLTGFLCSISGGEPAALEHEEIRWCEIAELTELDWAEADLPLVAELVGGEWISESEGNSENP